jgi:16S rRNA (cytidine1402-2'-O)-methyltransferase
VFEGFVPPRAGARAARLAALAAEPRAIVFFEAGRRLAGFLEAALAALGDRQAVIARELTKRHEELMRGTLSTLRERVGDGRTLRGEVTVLVGGASAEAGAGDAPSLDDEIRRGLAAGRSVREIASDVASRTGRPRREVYRRALALREGG